MNQSTETARFSPAPESPKSILSRVSEAASRLNQAGALPQEQRTQVVNTVLAGVIELHRQGVIGGNEKVRTYLSQGVFTGDPQRRILAETLVADIEAEARVNDPQAAHSVASRLELTSHLGINDRKKYPDLAARLKSIVAKTNPEQPTTKQVRAPRPQKNPPEDDFIPLAGEVELEESDVNQSAILVAFGDIITYLPETSDNRDMLEQVSAGNEQALLKLLSKLARLAVSRGYLDRIVQNLTRLTAQFPERAEEIIPILHSLSNSDSGNPEVHRLLGDSYLQLGQHREAIEAYTEDLKIPPKE